MNKVQLRKRLLKDAGPIIDAVSKASATRIPGSELMPAQIEALKHIWPTIHAIIADADDPAPLAKLTDGDITQRVDAVLSEVASGELTPDEGKKLIGLLQAGFDITELPKLIEKLGEIEKA